MQIHMLKFFTPSTPRPTPGAWPREQNENSGWYVLCILFVKTQTNFGIKIFEIYFANEMSWYLTFWPHPKVTSLTLWCKFYLHSLLLIIPFNLICHMTTNVHKCKPLGGGHLGYQTNPLLELGWEINKSNSYMKCGSKWVTRMCSRRGANANSHAQVFDPQ